MRDKMRGYVYESLSDECNPTPDEFNLIINGHFECGESTPDGWGKFDDDPEHILSWINDPTGELDIPGIKPQARFALYEMKQLMSFLGASMDNVVSITAYHKDCRDMNAVLEVAHEFWRHEKPAWTSVGQRGLHVKQMLIEIYGIAIVDEDIYQPYAD